MNASYEWLREFVPVPLTPAELRDLLTARVATVDDLVRLRADLAPIVVARVVEAARHPDADSLSVTKVDDGSGEILDVVCGAPNVQAGKLYPFARVGTVMPGGLAIQKRKIRGATSNGMLCSARELGMGQDHEGILELQVSAAPGTALLDVMPVGDTRLVVDVLPNRPDLLSHLGLAREIAAATGLALDPLAGRGPELSADAAAELAQATQQGEAAVEALAKRWQTAGRAVLARAGAPEPVARAPGVSECITDGVRVRVDDAAGCPRYLGAVVRGVRVGESPEWLRRHVESVGGRSVNNVVDVTNYMLHGFGQPMHAFDLGALRGSSVVVRRARAGETLVTLDGVSRALDPAMLVIADAERAQAIAGVMGGRESEVTERTTDIFLEVAAFDARTVRRTRTRLGIATDASYRFERGTDAEHADVWLQHAVHLLTEVAGGRQSEWHADVRAAPPEPRRVPLRVARVTRLLGERIAAETIGALLQSIGFEAAIVPGTRMLVGDEELSVLVPSWRSDVTDEVNLIEEVARLYGYDSFSSELRPYRAGTVPDHALHAVAGRVRDALGAAGLLEVRPMPFVQGHDDSHVRLTNPLAESEAWLRSSLLDTLARRAEYNLSHMQRNVRLYEVGSTFERRTAALPLEEMRAALLVMGDRRPQHFTEPRPPAWDEWDAKALAERLAVAAFPGATVTLVPSAGDTLWDIVVGADARGWVRRVPLDAPVWAAPAFGVELCLAELSAAAEAPPGERAYVSNAAGAGDGSRAAGHPRARPLPNTPAAEFDLALLVPDAIAADTVERAMRRVAGDLLERLSLFDQFRGAGVPAGHRSLAWRLTLRHPERTLRDKEVEGRREKILRTLESELGIRQRT